MTPTTTVQREAIDVDGVPASYLTAGDGPLVLLLHGTYWSRVWQPAIAPLAAAGLRPVAVDLPGCGRSGGSLTLETQRCRRWPPGSSASSTRSAPRRRCGSPATTSAVRSRSERRSAARAGSIGWRS